MLYKIYKGNTFYVADPSKGLTKYKLEDFKRKWASVKIGDEDKGIAMYLTPTDEFYQKEEDRIQRGNFVRLLFKYIKMYLKYFIHIFSGLIIACILQLITPFLTQSIVDIGISHRDINLICIILLGEFMIVIGHTVCDFIRRWILLHISLRINISLISDFFIKLPKLKMSFFDTKLLGDLLQRLNDHSRVQTFLSNQIPGAMLSFLNLFVFAIVLFVYNKAVFGVFIFGSMVYGSWMALFLKKRKTLDYEIFGLQSAKQNKTYQLLTSMQEIKLQNCERRRHWEWEDTQADMFAIQMESMKLQQTQEAGCILINELKNISITVLAATAVINGSITLGGMLAIQYIIGQLNSPIEHIMRFMYSLQEVKISLERINEIHLMDDEDSKKNTLTEFHEDKYIKLDSVSFKYDPHSLGETLHQVSFDIPKGKVTAIVGASGSGKTTILKLMLGYYKVADGAISIAGHNINEYNLKWWRKQCGVVMQDGYIFAESIARNIAIAEDTSVY